MIQKNLLSKYYLSGKSMRDISRILRCSEHKVTYWMNKHHIKRRSLSDAIYLQSNPLGDPFKLKNITNLDDAKLFGLGIGIYWGEGEKVTRHSIRVANSDIRVILLFRKFLLEICGLKTEKIKYSLICFNDSDVDQVAGYWSNELGTIAEKFGKIVQIPSQGKGTYKRKSQFGVCTIIVGNIKLKRWIMEQIDSAQVV